ncbi:MAG: hypothetical protein ACTSPM_05740 [Candidatus Heimdallarchaeota archaeon]
MSEFSSEKCDMVIELVTKQKKAKLQWVSTICQVNVDELIEHAEKMGLLVEEDYILIPSESKERKAQNLVSDKREQILTIITNNRFYRYNPAHSSQVAFDNVRKFALPMNRSTSRQIEWVIDQFATIKYVIKTLEGEMIETDEAQGKMIIETMKTKLRSFPDEILRLFVPIKKYLEFLIIPIIQNNDQYVVSMLLDQASKEDIRINNIAFNSIESSIIDRKVSRKGDIKEITIKLPNGQVENYKSNQLQKLFYNLMQDFEYNLRNQFYNQSNFVTKLIRDG